MTVAVGLDPPRRGERRRALPRCQPARRRAGDLPGQPAQRPEPSRRHRLGRERGRVARGRVGAVVGLAVATGTAMLLHADRASLRQGLLGFNGLLVGVAVPTFLAATPAMCGPPRGRRRGLHCRRARRHPGDADVGHAGAHLSVRADHLAPAARRLFLRGGHDRRHGAAGAGPWPGHAAAGSAAVPLFAAWLKGPAQVVFIDDWLSGVLVVLGLAVASLPAAAFALLGSGVAVVVALALGASPADVVPWALRLQSGADGRGHRLRLQRAVVAGRPLRAPRHRLHRHRAGGAQRRPGAARHPGPDRPLRPGDVALPAAAAPTSGLGPIRIRWCAAGRCRPGRCRRRTRRSRCAGSRRSRGR